VNPGALGRRLRQGLGRRARDRRPDATAEPPTVLILTPVKDAADCLAGYCRQLCRLTYPHRLLSLGILESDSVDTTYEALRRRLPALRREFRRVGLWQRDFGFRLPPGCHRATDQIQIERRTVLAKSRNHLLFHALDDEAWVLWLDVDVGDYPPDLVERLLATGKEIVQPHCVLDPGGPTFDRNAWRDRGRLHLDDLRDEGELVELDAVGGTMLLIRADLHRDGLIFPAFLYGRENSRIRPGRGEQEPGQSELEKVGLGHLRGEWETEGLGMMARDMGHSCWGMPRLEVIHRRR
jgi:hypothetical protein